MLESRIQANIKKKLTGLGWLVFKFESPGQRGVPDLIAISPDGETVYLEVKQPGKQATAYQMHLHRKILAHGARVYVVHSVDEALHVIGLASSAAGTAARI
jgi:Holliday junction resolvase